MPGKNLWTLVALAGLVVADSGVWLAATSRHPRATYPIIVYSTACVDDVPIHTATTPLVHLRKLVAAFGRESTLISGRPVPLFGRVTIPPKLQRSAFATARGARPGLVAISHRGSAEAIARLLACAGYRPAGSLGRGTLYRPKHVDTRWPVMYASRGLVIGANSSGRLARALQALAR